MLDALAAYVRAVRACPGEPSVGRRLSDQLSAIDDGAAGAQLMLDSADTQGAALSIAAMRHQLGLIAERFAGIPDWRASARGCSPRRARCRRSVRATRRASGPALARWKSEFGKGLAKRLRSAEGRSLYDRKRLAGSLR